MLRAFARVASLLLESLSSCGGGVPSLPSLILRVAHCTVCVIRFISILGIGLAKCGLGLSLVYTIEIKPWPKEKGLDGFWF